MPHMYTKRHWIVFELAIFGFANTDFRAFFQALFCRRLNFELFNCYFLANSVISHVQHIWYVQCVCRMCSTAAWYVYCICNFSVFQRCITNIYIVCKPNGKNKFVCVFIYAASQRYCLDNLPHNIYVHSTQTHTGSIETTISIIISSLYLSFSRSSNVRKQEKKKSAFIDVVEIQQPYYHALTLAYSRIHFFPSAYRIHFRFLLMNVIKAAVCFVCVYVHFCVFSILFFSERVSKIITKHTFINIILKFRVPFKLGVFMPLACSADRNSDFSSFSVPIWRKHTQSKNFSNQSNNDSMTFDIKAIELERRFWNCVLWKIFVLNMLYFVRIKLVVCPSHLGQSGLARPFPFD